MYNAEINVLKIQKLYRERGAISVLQKLAQLTVKRLTMPAFERTIQKCNSIFGKFDQDSLYQDAIRFFSSGLFRDVNDFNADFNAIPAYIKSKIIEEAQNLLYHRITIYGHIRVQSEADQFSWLRDPLTGFVWPLKYISNQITNQKPYGTDIKTLWEIARFQFLSSLAHAYVLTGEEKFACFAIEKVNSWIDENTFPYGPHWSRAMEVSIRLTNWCAYLPLLNICQHSDGSFRKKFVYSVLEHLIYIKENLEKSPSAAGNHYLANIVGLLLAYSIFPSLPWAVEVFNFAMKEFEQEVHRQFLDSGINFEGSLPYHRLSAEMVFLGAAIIKKNWGYLSNAILLRLRKIANFTNYYAEISNEIPLIGDNDSGIILKYFLGQESNQHRYLMYLFDLIIEDNVRPNEIDELLCCIHFATPDRSNSQVKVHSEHDAKLQVENFDGLIIAKYEKEALYFNALHSTEGHTHNDKLSIYPVIGGKLLFIDHGSFSYTGYSAKRHEDRMSSSHNGPVITNWEQNRIFEDDPFFICEDAKCDTLVEMHNDAVSITGFHKGYERYVKKFQVLRRIKWTPLKGTILIEDWLCCPAVRRKSYQMSWNFLIHPEWRCTLHQGDLIFRNDTHMVVMEDTHKIGFSCVTGNYCPSYQSESNCPSLSATYSIHPGEKVSFLLYYIKTDRTNMSV